MKTLTTLFALAILCAAASAQTIKSLGYDTASGEVVANTGTNVLTFTNLLVAFDSVLNPKGLTVNGTNIFETGINLDGGFFVDDNDTNNTNAVFIFQGDAEDQLRANARRDLGIPLPALTNTSNADMLSALGAARAVIWAYKATNQTNGTTNLVSDTALTFTAAANTKYLVTANLGFEYDGGETMVGKFIIPTNATAHGIWNIYFGALANYLFYPTEETVTNEQQFVNNHDGNVFVPQQFVLVTGANGGSVTFQFASTDANNVISSVGSYIKAEVIE